MGEADEPRSGCPINAAVEAFGALDERTATMWLLPKKAFDASRAYSDAQDNCTRRLGPAPNSDAVR